MYQPQQWFAVTLSLTSTLLAAMFFFFVHIVLSPGFHSCVCGGEGGIFSEPPTCKNTVVNHCYTSTPVFFVFFGFISQACANF